MNALDRAISHFGTQTAFAEALGIKPPSVSEWRQRGRVPVDRCADIERATDGAVTRYDLRPDIFGDPPAGAVVLPKKPKLSKNGGAKARPREREAA